MTDDTITWGIINNINTSHAQAARFERHNLIASVSSEGLVTANAEGTATVTATAEEGGFTASCSVTVSKTAGVKVCYRDSDHEYLYYLCKNGKLLYTSTTWLDNFCVVE